MIDRQKILNVFFDIDEYEDYDEGYQLSPETSSFPLRVLVPWLRLRLSD